MAEWKTWSLGDPPDEPDGSQPGRDGTQPGEDVARSAAQWGADVEPVTLERVEHVMEVDGFPVRRDADSLSTIVNGTPMRVHRHPSDAAWIQVEARADLPAGLDPGAADPFELQQAANSWNSQHLQPTAIPARADEQFFFHLSSRFFVGEGLSDRQIHLMVARGAVVTLQAVREVPPLVTAADD